MALTGTLSFAGSARAFCRSTACDESKGQSCPRDSSRCATEGAPLYWASGCVDLYVQQDGAPSEGIDWETTALSLQRALDAWLSVDCGGGTPSLQVNVMGPIECHQVEYNAEGRNANIVMFREQDWPDPQAQNALALTHPKFGFEGNGAMWDADIEINAFRYDFDPDGPVDGKADLDSVIIHEVGHWLGLDHNLLDPDATMYSPFPGGIGFRTLDPDDERGICAIYPPGRAVTTASCEPRHGFSPRCLEDQTPQELPSDQKDAGCSLVARPSAGGADLSNAAFAICGTLAGSWLRRSRRARGRRRARTVA